MSHLAGGSLTFDGTGLTAVSLTVEAPTPEVVDMTSYNDALKVKRRVRTGDYISPGSISIEAFLKDDPKGWSGRAGTLTFTHSATPALTITRFVIVDSVSVDARIGDVYRASFTMTPTDYTIDVGVM